MAWRRRSPAAAGAAPAPAPVAPEPPTTEEAWRTLLLVVDMIKHADAKAAATLATTGVLGGLLYTLAAQSKKPGVAFVVLASATAAAVIVAAIGAGVALRPRQLTGAATASLLFYKSINDRYPRDPVAYSRDFAELIGDRPALLSAVSTQAWHNASVATRKYRSLNIAVVAVLAAVALLAATAILGLLAGP